MFTDDKDIERELTAALDVAPSSDFESRVLRRVEEDHPARRLIAPVWLAATAAALAVIAGAWLMVSREPPAVRAPGTVTERTPNVERSPRDPRAARSVATRDPAPAEAARGKRRVPGDAAAYVAARAEPEVIVPGNQLHLIQQLVREVNAGRLFVPEPARAHPSVPSELVIAPVVIEPIPVVTIEPGGGSGSGSKGLQ